MRKPILWVLGGIAGLAVLLAVAARIPSVQDRLVESLADRLLGDQRGELFEDDALRVLLCGSASPLPHPTRAKPCVAVFAAGRMWLVDTGPGSWNRLALFRVDGSRIGGVLLTHFHSDHIGDLGEVGLNTWGMGRPGPLPVFGPPGVERVVAGFMEAYALDRDYRVAHHGEEIFDREAGRLEARVVAEPDPGAGTTPVLETDGLRITALAVDHDPVRPAYGYRFDYGGRSVVVSGDTVKDRALIEVATGADVLVHEAQANHLVDQLRVSAERAGRKRIVKIMTDIPSYHTTPVEAAEVANEAGVRLLVLYHLNPPPPARFMERVFTRGVSGVRPDGWVLGDDGLLVELPVGTQAVETTELR